MMDQEQSLKKQIIASAEAVKRKIKNMNDINTENEMALEYALKPITEPLKQIVTQNSLDHLATPKKENVLFTSKRKCPVNATTIVQRKKLSNKRFSFTSFDKNSDSDESNHDSSQDSDNEATNFQEYSNPKVHTPNNNDSYDMNPEPKDTSISDTSFVTTDDFSPRLAWSLSTELNNNIPFGVRKERGKIMLGKARVIIDDNKISVGGRNYNNTSGLRELLLKKIPDLNTVTESDKLNYKSMLLDTNAHRRDYDPNKPIKANKGMKYLQIIKPMFIKLSKNCATSESESQVCGTGLPVTKKLNKDIDYVYWDDPNELVSRLRLLVASRQAGNTGLDNEIISIIEELRESGIIE